MSPELAAADADHIANWIAGGSLLLAAISGPVGYFLGRRHERKRERQGAMAQACRELLARVNAVETQAMDYVEATPRSRGKKPPREFGRLVRACDQLRRDAVHVEKLCAKYDKKCLFVELVVALKRAATSHVRPGSKAAEVGAAITKAAAELDGAIRSIERACSPEAK